MTLSAYEEFYANFKERSSFKVREATGKSLALTFEELASAYKEGASLTTAVEFRQMVAEFNTGKLWGYTVDRQHPMYGMTRDALLDGALRSFQEGSPEKLYLAMTKFSSTFGATFIILNKAMVQSNDPYAAMQSILQTVAPELTRQALLDSSLSYAVTSNQPSVIEALLKAGADANQKSGSGFSGVLLLTAVRLGMADSTVKLLHDNGASFDDAIFMLRVRDGSKTDIEKLQAYQAKITGKPAPETELNGKMEALLAEMLEMKREILTLKKEVARLSRTPAKKSRAP